MPKQTHDGSHQNADHAENKPLSSQMGAEGDGPRHRQQHRWPTAEECCGGNERRTQIEEESCHLMGSRHGNDGSQAHDEAQ